MMVVAGERGELFGFTVELTVERREVRVLKEARKTEGGRDGGEGVVRDKIEISS